MVYFPTKTYQKPSRTSCDFFEGLLFAFSKDVAKIPSAVSGATRLTRSPTWDIFQSIALKLSELRNSMGFFLIFARRFTSRCFQVTNFRTRWTDLQADYVWMNHLLIFRRVRMLVSGFTVRKDGNPAAPEIDGFFKDWNIWARWAPISYENMEKNGPPFRKWVPGLINPNFLRGYNSMLYTTSDGAHLVSELLRCWFS